ncbi:MAG: RluA family pseudouridine synthase [Ignavibacteriales bacterium]|nr:RluA family pseudouridine synthase [Ignavibacteriales bacterium]
MAENTADTRETLRLVVAPKQAKERLDVYLTHQIQNATRTKIQQAISDGLVHIDGKAVKPSHLISPGEVIDVRLPRPPRPRALPEDIPLEIPFEDDDLLIVNKPAGMVTHPAYGNYSGTLVNALLHHTQALSSVNTEMRPGIVHRLDKDTTGLLVVAKNDRAHHALAKQFSRRTVNREYWAIVWGRFREKSGTIDAALARSRRDRKKVAVHPAGKPAVTEYRVLQTFEFLTLVALKLKTGRTHQIRVHLAHTGHPVFGDPTYGGRSSAWGGLTGKNARLAAELLRMIRRQALHARTIGFLHPKSARRMMFESRLPDDMSTVLRMIGWNG